MTHLYYLLHACFSSFRSAARWALFFFILVVDIIFFLWKYRCVPVSVCACINFISVYFFLFNFQMHFFNFYFYNFVLARSLAAAGLTITFPIDFTPFVFLKHLGKSNASDWANVCTIKRYRTHAVHNLT